MKTSNPLSLCRKSNIFDDVLEAVGPDSAVGVHDDEEVLVDAGVGDARPEDALAQDEAELELEGREAEDYEGYDGVPVPHPQRDGDDRIDNVGWPVAR